MKLRVFTLIDYKGLFIGFHWVHCNGESSKTSACIASYQNPKKVMWRWAIYWAKSFHFNLATQKVTV